MRKYTARCRVKAQCGGCKATGRLLSPFPAAVWFEPLSVGQDDLIFLCGPCLEGLPDQEHAAGVEALKSLRPQVFSEGWQLAPELLGVAEVVTVRVEMGGRHYTFFPDGAAGESLLSTLDSMARGAKSGPAGKCAGCSGRAQNGPTRPANAQPLALPLAGRGNAPEAPQNAPETLTREARTMPRESVQGAFDAWRQARGRGGDK